MNKDYDYKRLTPFKWFVLQNFPFIDEDFDAITNYQLFCKLGEEINKLIKSMNEAGQQVEDLTNYVSSYFDNLDVQDEINNKLDEMAEDGTLEEIISEYVNLKSILAYNSVAEMKQATNLIDGSFVETYGFYSANDGGNAKYKVREVTNQDVVDEMLIIALSDENLVAELMEKDKINVKQLGAKGDNIQDDTLYIQKAFDNFKEVIFTNGNFKTTNSITSSNVKHIKGNNNAVITHYSNDYLMELSQCSIEKMKFVTTQNECGNGIKINNAKNIVIKENTISGFDNNLILSGAQYSIIEKNNIKNWNTNGIYLYNTSADLGDNKIINNNFLPDNTDLTRDLTNAIYMTSSGGTIISGNKINWHDENLYPKNGIVWNSENGNTSDLLIENNSIENCSLNAIKINVPDDYIFGNIIINGNEIASYTSTRDYAIYIEGHPLLTYTNIEKLIISNNIIQNYTNGIDMRYVFEYNINNNQFVGNTNGINLIACKGVLNNNNYNNVTNKINITDISNNTYNFKNIINEKINFENLTGIIATLLGYKSIVLELTITGFIENVGGCYCHMKKAITGINKTITIADIDTTTQSNVTASLSGNNSTGEVTLTTNLTDTFHGNITYSISGNANKI